MGDSPLDGISLGVGGPAKVVSFTDDQLKNLGTEFGSRAKDVDGLIHGTGSIGIAPPAFGVLGIGLNTAHDTARDGAVNALKAGKAAIDSWNAALKAASENYAAAEKASTTEEKPGPGGLGGPGNLGGPGKLGGAGLPKMGGGLDGGAGDDMKFPGSGTDPLDKDLLDRKFPDDTRSLEGTKPDDVKFPDNTNFPGQNGTNQNLPDSNLPGAKLPDPNGVGGDLNKPGLGLDDPTKTALSSYNPPNVGNLGNLGNVPTGNSGLPGGTTWTGDTLGPGSSGRGGGFSGVGGNGALPGGLSGTGTGGAGGMGGMPMMPMAPGGAGGEQGKEREKTTWTSEDESVWGGDEDIAPPVIGQE
ncbi:hypothetical protein ABT340_09270 [Streptosporangium sp. NPDC000239]|uniref:hypothetical protein n=1 Tax=Streptosporangium sp. NPDC000239 TaxID=3154248 RepID=UPI00332BEF10